MTAQAIIEAVARRDGLRVDQIKRGGPRYPQCVKARHEIMARIRSEIGMSLPAIGRELGGFDHTTVMNGIRRYGNRDIETLGPISKRQLFAQIQQLAARVDSLEKKLAQSRRLTKKHSSAKLL